MKKIDNRVVLKPYLRSKEDLGIKETKEALQAAISIYEAIKLAKENDGVIDGKDTSLLLGVAMPLLNGVRGGDKIPAEWKDLSDAEIEELRAEFGSAINNPNIVKIFQGLLLMSDGVADEIRRQKVKPKNVSKAKPTGNEKK